MYGQGCDEFQNIIRATFVMFIIKISETMNFRKPLFGKLFDGYVLRFVVIFALAVSSINRTPLT